MTRYLVLALLFAGCVRSDSIPCDDGRLCPTGTVCVDELALCATPEQLSVCQDQGLAGGAACSAGSMQGLCNRAQSGETCTNCICLPARCGDGFVTAPEVCDGEALGAEPLCNQHGYYEATPVACSAACEYDAAAACTRSCGDGVVEPAQGELCDDDIDPADPCTTFGYDAGYVACFAGGCAPDFRTCRRIGWTPALRDTSSFTAITSTGGKLFVAAAEGAPAQLVLWTFDGTTWSRASTGVMTNPSTIWAASPTDIYVTGTVGQTGQLAHFDGTTWTVDAFTAAQTRLVYGTSSTDVWVFGDLGATRHFDGTSWTVTTITNGTTPRAAARDAAGGVWLSASSNRLFHFDGTWTQITTPLTLVYSVAAVGETIYVVGDGGAYRRDGTSWTPIAAALSQPLLEKLWGTSDTDLYILGSSGSTYGIWHYDGATWTNTLVNPLGPIALGGLGPDEVLLLRAGGVIDHYGGSAWEEALSSTTSQFLTVEGAANGDVFVVDNGVGVNRYSGGTRTTTSISGASTVGRAGADIYAGATTGQLFRWTGSVWQTESTLGASIEAIAGTDEAHVFASVGGAIAQRASNGTWTVDATTTTSQTLVDLWCDQGGSTCVAVGGTQIEMWNGTSWTKQTTATVGLLGVWGASPTNIYAVGYSGALYHFDGQTWSPQKITGESSNLDAIAGTAASDIVVITEAGQLYHFDGAHWAPIRQRGTGQMFDVWASDGEIWAVGDSIFGPGGVARILMLHRTYAWQ
ncbi:MAG TPA: hypothetical protein VL326_03440 [Kofleriaceae bacterium]|jgi:hypothetical protein|nr:hypothetical protein [Kofleriaceae bacterium]